MISTDRLAQLRAERDAQAAAEAARVNAEAMGLLMARETGRRLAAEVLPWHRVAALVAERSAATGPGYSLTWSARRDYLAPEVQASTLAHWVALLDGVREIAALVTGPDRQA